MQIERPAKAQRRQGWPNHNDAGSNRYGYRSLSPKRALEKMRQHRHAVMVLARQSAKKAIKAQIRAQGDKLTQVPTRTISIFADAYFDVHRERLIAEAEQIIATSPYFARWRCAELVTGAQQAGHCSDKTISVQMSGAERRADQ